MRTWKKPKDLPYSRLKSRHFYCDVAVFFFGVATPHFAYLCNVAALIFDVSTLL